MHRLRWIAPYLTTAAFLTCAIAQPATAGTYYVYGCSSYGNTAPAFQAYTNADHLTPANGCMQPAPGGGYRSLELNNPGPAAPVLHGYGANWSANSPSSALSIIGAYTPVNTVFVDCNLHADGFTAQYFWNGGTQAIDHVNGCASGGYGYGTGINASFAPSSVFGWGAGCWLASSCATSSSVNAVLGVEGVRLTVEEDSAPSVVADGGNNLWYRGGQWVRGGGWPVSFTATDPSGVCATDLAINGQFTSTDSTSDNNRDTSRFTQCWPSSTPTDTLDTRSFANGPLSIEYVALNAAGVFATPTESVQVDNTPVTLSLSTPNDGDPNAWVNHAVNVKASTSAGPSGIHATDCTTNNGVTYAYPSAGVTLNGSGVWTVACSASNNAVDVNGQSATSPTETVRVHIDETPPTIAFQPVSTSDPQAIVVDASDKQSGVSGGQIQMRPTSGGSWDSLPTRFDGAHLLARLDDASLAPGSWIVQSSACDTAGNCSSTQKTLTLPLRTASESRIGFGQVKAAFRCRAPQAPNRHRLPHRHPRRTAKRCRQVRLAPKKRAAISFGRRAVVHGTLTTEQGTPIGNAPVEILTAPDNGLGQYSPLTAVTTDSAGVWAASLPAGPSRIIMAAYGGSATIQPSTGQATLSVPASVRVLSVWPRHVRWGGRVHIRAQLLGGLLPPRGALVRLRLGYGSAKITYGVQEHVGGNGTFEVTNRFGPGPPATVRHYWLQECTLPQGDYPFAPACGPRSGVTVGGLRP